MLSTVYLVLAGAMVIAVNAQLSCNEYNGTVCRPVLGSGSVSVDTSSEAAFEVYKMNFTQLGVDVDATCEAFLRMQYCGLSTLTCTNQAHCGPYTPTQIGECGANSCKCTGSGAQAQGCNLGLRIVFAAVGGGLGYYVNGQQPQGTSCTEFNIPCPGSGAMGVQMPFVGVLVVTLASAVSMML